MPTYSDGAEYVKRKDDHRREGMAILHQMIGAQRAIETADATGSVNESLPNERRALAWDRYADLIAWWEAQAPTFDPTEAPF